MSDEAAQGHSRRQRRVGQTLAGRYFLGELLGEGGLGAVYAARDLESGDEVCVKRIDRAYADSEEVRARVAREVSLASAVDSPYVVRVRDSGFDDGAPFVVMDRLRGEDLGVVLAREGRLRETRALAIAVDVLDGLAAAHVRGVIHRDLKPDNVFMCDDGRAVLLDFGLSRVERPRDATAALALTGRGSVVGTPHYMAPEQARDSTAADTRSDLYGVGAILYECLTGRPPHVGESWTDVVMRAATQDPPDIRTLCPGVSEATARLVGKALARPPAARFTSAPAMATAARIAMAEQGAPGPAPREPQGSTSPTGAHRNTLVLAAAGLVVGGLGVLAAYALLD